MESKIPLPTDNIYKFYALFGLMLLITSIAAVVYLHQTTNAFLFAAYVEAEELASLDVPSAAQAKKREALQRQIDISVADKKFFNQVLGAFMGMAIALMAGGFYRWHYTIQPKQDKLLDLQIAKAEQDLKLSPRTPFRAKANTPKEV